MKRVIFVALPAILFACGGTESTSTSQPSVATEQSSLASPAGSSKDGGAAPDSGSSCTTSTAKVATCEADYELFKKARTDCRNAGAFLNAFGGNESCKAGSSDKYTYSCCPTKPSCSQGGGTGGPVCKEDNTFLAEFEKSCTGGSVATFDVSPGECPAGKSETASFTCSCL